MALMIAGISILAAWLLARLSTALEITIPWWVDTPSVLGFYGLFTTIFDRWLWRWPLLRGLALVRVPDLRGTWSGEIASSFDQHATRHPATSEIFQTWKRLQITLRTGNSQSRSVMAMLITEDPGGPILSYEYLNEPRPGATATMQIHRGTARLVLRMASGIPELNGEYYTGRGRQQYGSLSLRKQQLPRS